MRKSVGGVATWKRSKTFMRGIIFGERLGRTCRSLMRNKGVNTDEIHIVKKEKVALSRLERHRKAKSSDEVRGNNQMRRNNAIAKGVSTVCRRGFWAYRSESPCQASWSDSIVRILAFN